MKNGSISENIYDRSVKRIIDKYNKDLRKGTDCKADCAFLCAGEYELSDREDLWELELNLALTELYTRSIASEAAVAGKPAAMRAYLTIPGIFEENGIRQIITGLTVSAGRYKLFVEEVSVKASENVNTVRISLVITGCDSSDLSDAAELRKACGEKAGKKIDQSAKTDDNSRTSSIIMTGRAGTLGSIYLASRYEEVFSERFSKAYVRRMQRFPETYLYDRLSRADDIQYFPVGEGGIFAALWKLGIKYGAGLEVNLKTIPVYQECIEVCDIIDINIYMLFSGDCLLVVTDDAEMTIEKLKEAEIEASVIGKLSDNNDRVIINNDETRFLGKPEQDEIYKAVEKLEKRIKRD